MSEGNDGAIRELLEHLRAEREVLRAGRFGELAPLIAHKESLLAGLAGTPGARLAQAQRMARENQRLLAAAIEAARAARARLGEIVQGAQGYQSYDQRGRAQRISPERPTLEKRA